MYTQGQQDIKTAKISRLEGIFKNVLNDTPFKMDGMFFSPKQFAEYCVDKLDEAEIEAFERWHNVVENGVPF